MSDERRAEERLSYRVDGLLNHGNDEFNCYLVNISKGGALIAILDPHNLEQGDSIDLQFEVNGSLIFVTAAVSHLKEHMVGLNYLSISGKERRMLADFVENAE